MCGKNIIHDSIIKDGELKNVNKLNINIRVSMRWN